MSPDSRRGHAPSSSSTPVPRNRGEFKKQNSENFRARLAQSQGSVAERGNRTPACAKYGRSNSVVCRDRSTGFFMYG
ncbi:hypothetical protein H5410_027246 [Solanum commersonii]|uniref:Uncharacterized protein n=1 Tax=Solanum commersonii TaxID=4109 RepID=A0A9J5YZC9_SOLCO|nr:hypothetical protein H5410_027246 [Solanum commersonii]